MAMSIFDVQGKVASHVSQAGTRKNNHQTRRHFESGSCCQNQPNHQQQKPHRSRIPPSDCILPERAVIEFMPDDGLGSATTFLDGVEHIDRCVRNDASRDRHQVPGGPGWATKQGETDQHVRLRHHRCGFLYASHHANIRL